MNLVQRIQDILLRPKQTWPQIEAEPGDAVTLYKDYLMLLALVPAVASFIGLSLIGVGGFGMHFRVPILSGLVSMVVGYVVSLVMVFVLALIVDALAPKFGATKDPVAALKLVVYASTAGFLGGIFSLLPMLAILGALAGLYSLYLLYTGVPVLMKCPPEKAMSYTVVIALCAVVAGLVIGGISALLRPSPMRMTGAGADLPAFSIDTPGRKISVDTAKLQEAGRKMELASRKMEQAQASGDSAAAGKAAADVLGAITGSGGTPIAAQTLKAQLPEAVGDLPRESIEAQSGGAMGMVSSQAHASYRKGNLSVELSINDMGGLGGLMSVAGWANVTLDREANGRIEKVYKQGARTVRESYATDKSSGEYTLILANGVMVEGKGTGVDIGALRAAVAALDLAKIEAMKRPE